MCKYVRSQLLGDEEILFVARTHWAVYLPAFLAAAVTLLVFLPAAIAGLPLSGLALGFGTLVCILLGGYAGIYRRTTELAITDRRVIAKFGLIARTSYEIQLSRIESIHLRQSILGRILGFGLVDVRGTGGGIAPIAYVDDPDAFKRAAGKLLS